VCDEDFGVSDPAAFDLFDAVVVIDESPSVGCNLCGRWDWRRIDAVGSDDDSSSGPQRLSDSVSGVAQRLGLCVVECIGRDGDVRDPGFARLTSAGVVFPCDLAVGWQLELVQCCGG
jgi:hypothetical protein